jgi:hypothetical protein
VRSAPRCLVGRALGHLLEPEERGRDHSANASENPWILSGHPGHGMCHAVTASKRWVDRTLCESPCGRARARMMWQTDADPFAHLTFPDFRTASIHGVSHCA